MDERRDPFNISVSRKTARSDDISQVNLIVGWNELAKLTKLIEISFIGMFHKENMSSINPFHTKGHWPGLAASSRFSRSAVKKKNGKGDGHFSSHSNAVSLYEVFSIELPHRKLTAPW